MPKTKIIATLGPASANEATILSLIKAGVDVFRINFSHGDFEQHHDTLTLVNEARKKSGRIVAVMGDLCGPKIRTGAIDDDRILEPGDMVTIEPGTDQCSSLHFGTNYPDLSRDLEVGHRVFIDDGTIALRVIKQQDHQSVCQVILGGCIRSHKGINLPDTVVSTPSITEKDWQCAQWAVDHDLDFLALSFVRSAQDILELKAFLNTSQSPIRIVAKLETPAAIEQYQPIILASDVTLIARGDLGVEMDPAQVPLVQKDIARFCRAHGKPVIVATHMLQSMISSPTATRAEVSDLANAIMDYTDAVMLSGETAIGKYPLRAIKIINDTAETTETYLDSTDTVHPKGTFSEETVLSATIASCVAQIVDDIQSPLVAVWSQGGLSAQLLGKTRIDVPILALSSDMKVCRQMCLNYGVIPNYQETTPTIDQFTHLVDQLAQKLELARKGDTIVLVTGRQLGDQATTNAIVVHAV